MKKDDTLTKDMLRELDYLKDNTKTVAENEIPINTPMYFFISDDQVDVAIGWGKALSDYLSKITTGKHIQLATGHYVHHGKADIISEEAKAFIEGVK